MLDLILVGDERRLVDSISTDQQLIVQRQREVHQAEAIIEREVQRLNKE